MALLLVHDSQAASSYYVDAIGGSDFSDGLSPATAWKTLSKVNTHNFSVGDAILLKSAQTHTGTIRLEASDSGSVNSPVTIGSYANGAKPIIDAAGYRAGVQLVNAQHVLVRDLAITANGGATIDGSDPASRYGVFVRSDNAASPAFNINLRDLHIYDIFPEVDTPHEGANPTTYMGMGVFSQGTANAPASSIRIRDSRIERTGFTGVRFQRTDSIEVLNNTLTDIGGPGIQPSRVNDMFVEGNVVNRSGSLLDPRMHGRGSGMWPWSSNRVTVQHNAFMNARGRNDSAGIHIDFANRDVIVQHNLSVNNAGGFLEILGDNHNSTYRHNISINDGWRVAGKLDQGSLPNDADGKILWLGGWMGSTGGVPNDYLGPYNTYIYNNTVYVKPGQTSHFRVTGTAQGAMVVNNIFQLEGPVSTIFGSWKTDGQWFNEYSQEMIDSMLWENNLYNHEDSIPTDLPFVSADAELIGLADFANPGGLDAEDYLPLNVAQIANQGHVLSNLPGDAIGVLGGLSMSEDFLGDLIWLAPDLGAIELQPGYLPGDYNADGDVDAADYTVWRDGGAPYFTQAGRDLWRTNYGATANGANSTSPAPEPASIGMLISLLALWRDPRNLVHTHRATET